MCNEFISGFVIYRLVHLKAVVIFEMKLFFKIKKRNFVFKKMNRFQVPVQYS